ncbi:MAG TPA: carboxypeptidase-like regulatory domain-containing protein [Pyrinomonadaceae bacterium]|nr:carboxypeptidase-like regulatory domain-containing protein [Pyrinomonadaceae bacterium]
MSRTIQRVIFSAALVLCAFGAHVSAQQAKEVPATLTGRVTHEGKGVGGVAIAVVPGDRGPDRKPVARGSTDPEGNYRITNIPPGRYQVVPLAPSFIVADVTGYPAGKPISLSAGETVEDIDFRLTRGGVITGRVTDSDGRPVIAEQVQIVSVDGSNPRQRAVSFTGSFETDDRGIYRAYGLPAGRYRVSAGHDRQGGMIRVGMTRGFYPQTFHPDTPIEAEAKIIEVEGGDVADEIDIRIGKPTKTFRASGRFISAETGQPVPNLPYGYGALLRNEGRIGGVGMGFNANARGEFTIDGIAPGRYGAFAISRDETDWYSDVVPFEITDSDISGLEVRIHRGATITGSVFIEGVRDRATLTQLLSQVSLFAFVPPQMGGLISPRFSPTRIAADGTFRMTGLRPGTVGITLNTWQSGVRGLSLLRVEREGVELRNGQLEVGDGAQVTGVRVVLAYGAGVIRGQIVLRDGDQTASVPPGVRLIVFANRVGASPQQFRRGADADARGRFIFEGLPAGDYELTVPALGSSRAGAARQVVTVPDSGEVNVTINLEIKMGGDRP